LNRIWFEKDEERVFNFVGNFADAEPDERSRDWSVTAWGTEHPLEVKHVDNIQTAHSPVHDDDFRSKPELIPYPGYNDEGEKDDDENEEHEQVAEEIFAQCQFDTDMTSLNSMEIFFCFEMKCKIMCEADESFCDC